MALGCAVDEEESVLGGFRIHQLQPTLPTVAAQVLGRLSEQPSNVIKGGELGLVERWEGPTRMLDA